MTLGTGTWGPQCFPVHPLSLASYLGLQGSVVITMVTGWEEIRAEVGEGRAFWSFSLGGWCGGARWLSSRWPICTPRVFPETQTPVFQWERCSWQPLGTKALDRIFHRCDSDSWKVPRVLINNYSFILSLKYKNGLFHNTGTNSNTRLL